MKVLFLHYGKVTGFSTMYKDVLTNNVHRVTRNIVILLTMYASY